MANTDAAFGFRPVEKMGSGPNGKLNPYKVASDEAGKLHQGDAVMPDSGFIQQADVASDICGVFWGAKYDDPTTQKPTFTNFLPAAVGAVADAFVYDDPFQVFEIQGDSGTASLQTQIFQSADIVDAQGSTTTGISGQELDSSDISATAQQCIIMGFSGDPERGAIDTSGHAVYKVLIQQHVFSCL
tara:strand:+ start:1075 stop:1632 length:558 start_codon:yes stop_codon:yes gene_type:complete